MSKPYTGDDFALQITEDRTWRIKEISDLKSAIKRGDSRLQKVLLRALVAICYAHWEGYIRFAARKYLEHVALRRLQYGQLNRQFFRNYFLPRLGVISTSKVTIAERCALIDEILDGSEIRYSHANEDLVNTRANLSFDVFKDICIICGVSSISIFEEKSHFIDLALLKRRNSIAHGEETMVGLEDLDYLTEYTIDLIRSFGNELENLVFTETYKAAQSNF